ncbi:hypothetical protein F5144DRAFT_602533 [Chaetomium tenue]|uniref:Uncharacterized protein n=1 Tax=Chaetomium tenue TaxID=1854479 RepID=A0ACB7PC27_9PEZI|nr:hypothetical protein F5144DRAFT_602533 [Chaetomium globosum]
MMKAVRRHNRLWAETGTGSATAVDVVADEEPANDQKKEGGHGPAAITTLGQGHGRVSDLTLHPQDASRRSRHPLQNADIPPVTFPGGRNPYLDRPLPPPPSRNIAGALNHNAVPLSMPARPSTSSGPGSSKSGATKSRLDNRLSKDDIALTRAGKGQYPVPTALWLLTPEPSPHRTRMASPPSAMSPPAMLPTPQSSASGEVQIGMALGSPTQDSTPYSGSPQAGWLPQSQTSVRANPSPPPVQTPEPTVQRSKTQKRRLFGLFGSRKHAEPPKAFGNAEANRSTSSVTPTVSNESSTPARSNTVAGRKTPKHKPIVIRSMTMSQADAVAPQPDMPVVSAPIPSTSTGGAGLLNIDIPDIRLERYSVMFSGVLNPNGTKSSLLERRQATLEKLKTISDRIEHLEGQDKTKPRRATSPQPMKSPAFSLFPQTPNRQSGSIAATGIGMASQTSLAPPRGLTRSNTSPAYLPSPSRASFEPPPQGSPEQSRKERKTVTIVSPRAMDERNRAAQVEKLREQQARQAHQARLHPETAALSTTTFHFHPNESSLILDSPQSATSSSSSSSQDDPEHATKTTTTTPHHRHPALKPTLHEPQWEIITPPSSTTSSAAPPSSSSLTTTPLKTQHPPHSRRTPSASSTTTTSTSTSRPSLDTTASIPGRVSVDEADAALKAAVEISIARQISISRQQRRLLRPFGASSSGASMGVGGNGIGGRGRSATTGAVGVGSVNGRGMVVEEDGEEELTVGVVKGKVAVTNVVVGGGGKAGARRSERVVLDVVQ